MRRSFIYKKVGDYSLGNVTKITPEVNFILRSQHRMKKL